MRALWLAGACAFLVALSGCGGGGGGDGGGAIFPVATAPAAAPAAPEPAAPATPAVVSASIQSTATGASYPLEIYVPASYAAGTASYPVIYALDGDALYAAPDTRFTNFKNILQRRGTNAILVGIGGTARRGQDFVPPGVTKYHDFLTLELIPFVEANYRADPARRILSGLSLGGSVTATALFLEAPKQLYFSTFLSSEGTFNASTQTNELEQTMFSSLGGREIPATLILAHGTGAGTNEVPVRSLYQLMESRKYKGLQLIETAFPLGHVQMDGPAFEDAVQRLLN